MTGAQTGSNDSSVTAAGSICEPLCSCLLHKFFTVVSESQKRNIKQTFHIRKSPTFSLRHQKKREREEEEAEVLLPLFEPTFWFCPSTQCFNVVQINSWLPPSVHRRWLHSRTCELFLQKKEKKKENRAFHFYTTSVSETFKVRHPGLQTSSNFDVQTL